jgi:gas vesicle protein
MDSNHKSSAELEREVEAQRLKVENRIGEIRERLSPGQIIDEVLSYGKDGGQAFVSNLGSTVASNPIPAALLGISLAWLMSGKAPSFGQHEKTSSAHSYGRTDGYHPDSGSNWEPEDYPYHTISGGIRRVGHARDDAGDWYSEFEDTAGKRYTARSNEQGHRHGHFLDDAGRKIRGFIDEAGHRVRDFQDESGNKLGDAMGWASHTFSDVKREMGHRMEQFGDEAKHVGEKVSTEAERAAKKVMSAFESQPLVAGALAFAAGAALGATLPHTREEDAAIGKVADKVRGKAMDAASDLYDEGKEKAGELYEKGKEKVGEVYEDARQNLGANSQLRGPGLH